MTSIIQLLLDSVCVLIVEERTTLARSSSVFLDRYVLLAILVELTFDDAPEVLDVSQI